MEEAVHSIKLVTGEEVITRLAKHQGSADVWVLDRPRALAHNPVSGELSFGPVLFMANPDGNITLNKSAVVCYTTNLRDGIADSYIQAVSSIQIPKKRIITG